MLRRGKGSQLDCFLLAINGDIQALNAGSPKHTNLHTVQKVDRRKWKMGWCTTIPNKKRLHKGPFKAKASLFQ